MISSMNKYGDSEVLVRYVIPNPRIYCNNKKTGTKLKYCDKCFNKEYPIDK